MSYKNSAYSTFSPPKKPRWPSGILGWLQSDFAKYRFGSKHAKPRSAQHLVQLLLCQGARAGRLAQPIAKIRLSVRKPGGGDAVLISFGRTSHQSGSTIRAR